MKAVYLERGVADKGDVDMSPLLTVCPDITFYENTNEEDKYDHIGDAEIVFTNKVVIDEEVLSRCPAIKYVGVCATGYNVVDLDAAKRHGVIVTNVPAYSTESVAQHTFALLLEIAGHPALHDESVKNGEWVKSEAFCYWKTPVIELSGKTFGVYGFGSIGRRVAEIAKAFGMNVLVHTAHPAKYESFSTSYKFVDEDTLYRESDIVSFHCPLTDETAGIINARNIDKMKKNVIIINVSRGGLANEVELRDCLNSGRVYAYGTDTVDGEPMKADNPLLNAKNAVITPHMAWASKEARTRLVGIIAGNVKGYLTGHPVNVV